MSFYGEFASVLAAEHLQAVGESIVHIPAGIVANSVAVDVIVHRTTPLRDDERGEGIAYSWKLDVPSSMTLDEEDQWTIGGREFKTRSFGESRGGIKEVMISDRDEIYTTHESRGIPGR